MLIYDYFLSQKGNFLCFFAQRNAQIGDHGTQHRTNIHVVATLAAIAVKYAVQGVKNRDREAA